LAISILTTLKKIKLDKDSAFSIPIYQKNRGGLKRYQAVQELDLLKDCGFVDSTTGYHARFVLNISAIKIAPHPTYSFYPLLICLRLLADENKESALLTALNGENDSRFFVVSPPSFRQVPGTPFCYWVNENVRRIFTEFKTFEDNERTAKQGLATADDFRFVRVSWEVHPQSQCPPNSHPNPPNGSYCVLSYRWFPFAKGGEYAPYYSDIHLLVDWGKDGYNIRNYADPRTGKVYSVTRNTDFYFQAGLTWSRRSTSNFSPRTFPLGCVFADKGPVAILDIRERLAAIGILFSQPYQTLLELSLAAGDEVNSGTASRSYEVGIIQKLPWVDLSSVDKSQLNEWVYSIVKIVQNRDTQDETTKVFVCPEINLTNGIRESTELYQRDREEMSCEIIDIAAKIDVKVAKILGIPNSEREKTFGEDAATLCAFPDRELDFEFDKSYRQNIHSTIREEIGESGGNRQISVKSFYASRRLEVLVRSLRTNPRQIAKVAAERHLVPDGLETEFAQIYLSYLVGCNFGRWDIRYATGDISKPDLPDPFDPLPACAPGMLVANSGFPPSNFNELSNNYPVKIPFNGILVDDEGHNDDIINRVRDVLKLIWRVNDSDIEQEACEILEVNSLRDYFRKPTAFFDDHLSRYSKSRRQAPIYLPLSTRSGSYTIWLYYHRLTDQTLYTCINDYIEPKLLRTRDLTSQLRNQSDRTSSETKQLETLQDLEAELTDLRDELLRVAQLPFKPNLNDGVQITVAPLWQLFRLPKWQKKLKETWDKLEQGEYDWAHLAYSIWSERVRAKCKTDKSLAIAHDLESLYEPPPEKPKSSSKKKRKTAE
jgi:hypothetical protein